MQEGLRGLFVEAGFVCQDVHVHTRTIANRRQQRNMQRRWVQGVFCLHPGPNDLSLLLPQPLADAPVQAERVRTEEGAARLGHDGAVSGGETVANAAAASFTGDAVDRTAPVLGSGTASPSGACARCACSSARCTSLPLRSEVDGVPQQTAPSAVALTYPDHDTEVCVSHPLQAPRAAICVHGDSARTTPGRTRAPQRRSCLRSCCVSRQSCVALVVSASDGY